MALAGELRAGATPAALAAVAELLTAGTDVADVGRFGVLVAERARALLRADVTGLVALEDGEVVALDPPDAIGGATLGSALGAGGVLAGEAGLLGARGDALVARLPAAAGRPLALVAIRSLPFDAEDLPTARVFAAAAAAGLSLVRAARRHTARDAEQAALRRAAGRLNAHLDVMGAVQAICEEARGILGADYAAVYRHHGEDGVVVAADVGVDPSLVGTRLALGQGMAGKVAESGRALYSDDYMSLPRPGPASLFDGIRTCYGAPLRWDGEVRGALSVGFFRVVPEGRDGLPLLEAFADLASVAYRNAETATRLTVAARTDALTGCLNHGAFVDEVERETARAARTGRAPALVVVDLDRFKAVNDEHGHRTGDDLLRAAGDALRAVTRAEDVVGRLGGDEFGVLLVDADRASARATAERLLAELQRARDSLEVAGTAATAGLARWAAGVGGAALIEAADGALMEAKRSGRRGEVSIAPDAAPAGEAPASVQPRVAGSTGADRTQRRLRSLALTNRLAARIAGLTDVSAIAAAVVEELHRAFDFHLSSVIRITPDARVEAVGVHGTHFEDLMVSGWSQPVEQGLIGRCLRTRAPVRVDDVRLEPDYQFTDFTGQVRSECVVPLTVGGRLWGAVNVEELAPGAFDEEDQRLLETIASITGAALRAALLYESLDDAYLGTVQALATALELKDGYTADHADAVGRRAEAVGRALGVQGEALRDLRLGAALHDIGKLAVPEAILNKPGRLTPEEREIVERHVVAGDRILAGVTALAGARRIVRHSHERYDGGGYPDGLAAGAIPLGARIVFVCDAYDAMTTNRPYRAGMAAAAARDELRRCAGSQFDPAVVAAFLGLDDTA